MISNTADMPTNQCS